MGEKSTGDPNNIREMNIETDLDQVKKIWRNGVKEAHKEFISTNFWDSIDIEEEIRNANERYVYEENRIIRGFITVRQDGYIFELYVDFRNEDFRRRGIGKVLFETLQGKNPKFPQLKGKYSRFSSSVYAHNHESFAWHIKRKFKVTGIHFCPDTGLPKFDMIWEQHKKESLPNDK